METTKPIQCAAGSGGGNSAPIYRERFAPVPIWVLETLATMPRAEAQVMLVLYAHRYKTLPWGGSLETEEIAHRSALSLEEANEALLKRSEAGWIHSTRPGCWAMGPEGSPK